MRAFEDGWIDKRSHKQLIGELSERRTAEEVRGEVEAFRGRVISRVYNLERLIDALIVWHLFRDRDDGMAAIFEEDILFGGSLGLDRKVRLARKIAAHWLGNGEEDLTGFDDAITSAKMYRDCVAHWPTRLLPILDSQDETVDYLVSIEKGGSSTLLTSEAILSWLRTIEEAILQTQKVIDCITESVRSGIA